MQTQMISHCKFIEYIYDKKYFEKMVLFEYKKIVKFCVFYKFDIFDKPKIDKYSIFK